MNDNIFSIIDDHMKKENSESTQYCVNRIIDDLMDYAIFQILSELGEEDDMTDENVISVVNERFPKHKREMNDRIQQLIDMFDTDEDNPFPHIYYELHSKYQ